MGEPAKRVADSVCERFPDVPWRELAAFRDRLAHAYDALDDRIVWDAVQRSVPATQVAVRAALDALAPAATTVVAVDELYGYTSRGDLSVIVFSVSKGMATYRGQFDLTRTQLEQHRFRIELSQENLAE